MSKSQSYASRIGSLAIAIVALVVAVWLAFDLLSRIWGWLVLTACLAAATVIGVRVLRARRDRW